MTAAPDTVRSPELAYEDIPGVNISTLKELWQRSPKHYRHRLSTPREDSPAMLVGRAFHCLTLEPSEYANRYAIMPPGLDRRTKAGREWVASLGDREVLTASQAEQVAGMAAALADDPHAGPLLSQPGLREVGLVWDDEATQLHCKGRLDLFTESGVLVDAKSTSDVTPRAFARSVVTFGYHLQLAFYLDGLRANGHRVEAVKIAAVESRAPHDVVLFVVPDDILDLGRREYRSALVTLAECRERNEWPGVAWGEVELELPEWAWDSVDDNFTVGGVDAR